MTFVNINENHRRKGMFKTAYTVHRDRQSVVFMSRSGPTLARILAVCNRLKQVTMQRRFASCWSWPGIIFLCSVHISSVVYFKQTRSLLFEILVRHCLFLYN